MENDPKIGSFFYKRGSVHGRQPKKHIKYEV